VFQALGAVILKARSPNLSLDRGIGPGLKQVSGLWVA